VAQAAVLIRQDSHSGRKSAMRKYGPQLFLLSLLTAAAIALASGSFMSHVSANCTSSSRTANATGIPQSITVCPATADARDFRDGLVQFIATGYRANHPPVTPLASADWGAC
jgi:hypothetical protein